MSPDKIIVTVFSLGGIAFTYWFFLMKREKATPLVSGSVEISVDGGYQPDVVTIPLGKTTTLHFLRNDTSSCLEEVVVSDFKIRKYLPLRQKISITITPHKTGEYPFSCGMNMFHGKLIVV